MYFTIWGRRGQAKFVSLVTFTSGKIQEVFMILIYNLRIHTRTPKHTSHPIHHPVLCACVRCGKNNTQTFSNLTYIFLYGECGKCANDDPIIVKCETCFKTISLTTYKYIDYMRSGM